MKIFILVLTVLIFGGCTSSGITDGLSSITKTTDGVEFVASRPVEMSMEKDGTIYKFNSQIPSLLSRIMSAVTLGVVGTRN